MNMLLHGVKDTEFEIFHGDTLLNEWDILRELNPAKKPLFDTIVANPPFPYRIIPVVGDPAVPARVRRGGREGGSRRPPAPARPA